MSTAWTSLEGKLLDGDVETGIQVKVLAARVSKKFIDVRNPGRLGEGKLTDNPPECDDRLVYLRLNDDGGHSFKLSCGLSRCTRFQTEMRVVTLPPMCCASINSPDSNNTSIAVVFERREIASYHPWAAKQDQAAT